ncbi:MAG: SRPBCC family protein [Nitrososphaerota archaeon]|nr:SRPBCC family protein [Nitrososphaerota archaeon]
MHVEVSKVVKARREKVFAAYTDFESMPRWSKQVTAMRVVGREGSMVRMESENRFGGGSTCTRRGADGAHEHQQTV